MRMPGVKFFWIMCGNCGKVYADSSLEETIHEYTIHIRDDHRNNIHLPQVGWVENKMNTVVIKWDT